MTGLRCAALGGTLVALLAAGCEVRGEVEEPLPVFLNSGAVLPATLPFSEGVRLGSLVLLSGQIGVKPGTLELVPGGMPAEARQTMENIRASLEANGLTMANIVKCTVMLADMSEWGAFNEIYGTYFAAPYPARSAFGTSGLALGARVEVECIASAPGNRRPQ